MYNQNFGELILEATVKSMNTAKFIVLKYTVAKMPMFKQQAIHISVSALFQQYRHYYPTSLYIKC